MKRQCILLISIFYLLSCQLVAAESTLLKVARADSKDVVQIFFSFDTLPIYTHKVSTKRIDILLEDTTKSSSVQLFEGDDRIIKTFSTHKNEKNVISFFFRYQPQKVHVEESSDGKLVLDVLLGNRYSRSYQDLSDKLKGITVVEDKQVDVANPLTLSPYAKNWSSFFNRYEAKLDITVPISFTSPPFPIIALIPPGLESNRELLSPEVLELAKAQLWNDISPLILEQLQTTRNLNDQKLLALTYGEALFRSDDYISAYKQLYLLQKEYPKEHTGIIAGYLLTLLEAQQRDPYLADTEFKTLEKSITPLHPVAPYFLLSRAETALATKQYNRAFQLLTQDDIPFPGVTQKIRELRLGDYYSATNQLVKSYVVYQLLEDTNLLGSHPYSLNGYCDTLYQQKKYNQAAGCYRELAPQVGSTPSLGLITFRAGMAELHFSPASELINSFSRIEDAFPESEAADRAAIKHIDLKYMATNDWSKQAANLYGNLAQSSIRRATSSEAAFKEALTYSLIGDNTKSIELLTTFLRDFQVADLRETAHALLIDILPGEIKRLIDNAQFLEALILAKKNRELFQNNWLDESLLSDIGNAYQKVGIFSESQRVYLYLLEIADVKSREQYFLPLIHSAFNQGEYGLVEDFASQYSYNYPDGPNTDTIRNLRIRSLIATGKYQEANELLPIPLPNTLEIRLLASDIYFQNEDYNAVVSTLTPLDSSNTDLPSDAKFILAESRYQNGDHFGAEALFPGLADTEQFGHQSLYRLAQIERKRGNEENALKFLTRIVEKDNESPWKRYAEKELQYSQLNKSINDLIDS